ncbi:olfactory receptor 51I2-like [Mirounga angustirostris]|uniref:olfactory receptor 51I2-like n=1 Tax=Mirounga angustirostris TaxID=9716 RepID=UPI001E68B779|nr:olfactory receptor 51I2-like [Mirounga angustirostris]
MSCSIGFAHVEQEEGLLSPLLLRKKAHSNPKAADKYLYHTKRFQTLSLLGLGEEGEMENISGVPPFLLTGIPGLESSHSWLAGLLCVMYALALGANTVILRAVQVESNLHEPMYYFLSMLSFSDVAMSMATLPTVLRTFCLNAHNIAFDACLIQMFLIHSFSMMQSGILLAMSFDRHVASCDPLHYATVLTNGVSAGIGIAVTARSFITLFPLPFLFKRLPICRSNVLSHSYCLHPDMIKLACADITINSIYGLFVLVSTFGMDLFLIFLSYVLILHSVMAIASRKERLKALNTRVSHTLVVLAFYVPMIGISVVHRFGKHAPHYRHVLMSNVYLFVPPVLNPLVYSAKTKEIQRRLYTSFILGPLLLP